MNWKMFAVTLFYLCISTREDFEITGKPVSLLPDGVDVKLV